MTASERTLEARHVVGAHGSVVIRSIAARVIVRGVDGDVARVELRHGVRTADPGMSQRIEEAFESGTLRSDGRLEVSSGEGRRFWTDAGPFAMIARAFGIGLDEGMVLEAEVPRGADVHVETVSGSVEASGLSGRARYRTVSGDLRLSGSGQVSVDTTSGGVEVEAEGEVMLDWHSVSGSLRARAPLFRGTRLDTMSGAMLVAGRLAPDGAHQAHSVSGTLSLEAHDGLTVETRMLSGSVRSQVEHRLEGRPGSLVLVTGDGARRLRFDTMSGDLIVLDPERAQAGPGPVPAGPAPTGDVGASTAPVEDARLAILQAVERGEIGVDEAMRQLRAASDA